MRVDANVSVRPLGTDELGLRCEIKNVNSLALAWAGPSSSRRVARST